MRTWLAILVAGLGLFAVEARADEPIKSLPEPVAPPAVAAPAEKPITTEQRVTSEQQPIASSPACCQSCQKACGHSGCVASVVAWLTYRPCNSECYPYHTPIPRRPALYTFFMNCHEGPGSCCAKPACGAAVDTVVGQH
jgi:hypothetical protein